MPHRLKVLAQEAGFRGLFAGLGPRMVMTAGLVSGQFLMYDGIKTGAQLILTHKFTNSNKFISTALGAPPALEIHKEN